jgi:uncharacterized protein
MTSVNALTAKAVAAIEALGRRDVDEAMSLCTEDLVLELPYATRRGIEPLYSGKAAVRDTVVLSFGVDDDRFSSFHFIDVRGWQLQGQERVLVEYRCEGVFRSTGDTYQNRYMTVLTFSGGLISHWREFFSPLASVTATPLPEYAPLNWVCEEH